MLTLYHGKTSVCSQKVRLVLKERELEWESRDVDIFNGAQFDPAYLALNPDAVVPTLVHDGRVLVESSIIIEYLDTLGSAPRLMPADPEGEFRTRLWLLRCLDIHDAINTMTFATSVRDRNRATKTPEEIEAGVQRLPNPQRAAKRRELFEQGVDSAYVGGAVYVLDRTLRDMARGLAESEWLCGKSFGLADAALLSYIDRLDLLGLSGLWHGRHAGVAEWLAKIQARPSYDVALTEYYKTAPALATRTAESPYWPAIAAKLH